MIRCPHCHKLNRNDANFCKYCGAKLDSHNDNTASTSSASSSNESHSFQSNSSFSSSISSYGSSISSSSVSNSSSSNNNNDTRNSNNEYTTTQPNPNTNQSNTNNFANHYFTWLGKSLIHPSSTVSSSRYFGIISFASEAVLLIIALLIGTHSSSDGNQLISYVGELPISVFYENSFNDAKPLAIIILVLLFFALLILVGFVGSLLVSRIRRDFLAIASKLAGYTNLNIICLFLMLVSVLLQSVLLSWLFAVISKCILFAGLGVLILNASHKKSNIDFIYVFIGSIVAFIILTGLFATVVGILFQ